MAATLYPCHAEVDIPDGSFIEIGGCYSPCAIYTYSSGMPFGCGNTQGITIKNSTGGSLNVLGTGGVDDEFFVDGIPWPNGRYPFYCSTLDGIGECGPGRCSGAHNFTYNQTLTDGQSVFLQGFNNGGPGGINITLTFS